MKDALPSSAEIEALREENRKLRKINAALIDRVERSSDMAGNAFSMFETAISLEAMVRERTAQLEDALAKLAEANADLASAHRSEEHTSELQSLMRISYAVFCLKKKKKHYKK